MLFNHKGRSRAMDPTNSNLLLTMWLKRSDGKFFNKQREISINTPIQWDIDIKTYYGHYYFRGINNDQLADFLLFPIMSETKIEPGLMDFR